MDDCALRKAYNELEKWQNQYKKLMKHKDGFCNTSNWKVVSKLGENSSSNELLMNLAALNLADSCEGTCDAHTNIYCTADSSTGDNVGFEVLYCSTTSRHCYGFDCGIGDFGYMLSEDLSEEIRHEECEMIGTTEGSFMERETMKTKPFPKAAASNPYLNFLRRLEESENVRIRTEKFQQEVSELSSKFFDELSGNLVEKRNSEDGRIRSVIAEDKRILQFLFNRRKHHEPVILDVNVAKLLPAELSHKDLHLQYLQGNNLVENIINPKPQRKYKVLWYTDCKKWFKPRLKDEF